MAATRPPLDRAPPHREHLRHDPHVSELVDRLVALLAGDEPHQDTAPVSADGIALRQIPQVNPDVVTLDIEMPEMDGLETLAAIRERYPDLAVIMFSTLTARGAAGTVEALLGGANDDVTKPANAGGVQEAMQAVREQLVPKTHALCGRTRASAATPAASARVALATPTLRPRPTPRRPTGPAPRVDAVVIGVSTAVRTRSLRSSHGSPTTWPSRS